MGWGPACYQSQPASFQIFLGKVSDGIYWSQRSGAADLSILNAHQVPRHWSSGHWSSRHSQRQQIHIPVGANELHASWGDSVPVAAKGVPVHHDLSESKGIKSQLWSCFFPTGKRLFILARTWGTALPWRESENMTHFSDGENEASQSWICFRLATLGDGIMTIYLTTDYPSWLLWCSLPL